MASLSSAWTTFVASLSTNPANLSIDLKALFGSSKLVMLLKQGKFNVALAGGVVASSVNASSTQTAATTRTYGVYVDGW
ncbi:MAG: hypothetical protein NTY08_09580 [Proteobacteria bacterium]|nr:hypothetical protein [Pseudomonadota bacterium]